MNLIILTAILGLFLSLYAGFVEQKAKKEKYYQAVCDLNKHVSCTKAFKSPYGHLFGISNSILGIGAYLAIIIGAIVQPKMIFLLTLPGFLISIYLAYISWIKLKNFCIVCIGIYVINTLLLLLSL